MIHVITGRPGAGKTLYAVTKGIELVGQGREVYEFGFAELNHDATGIKPFPYATLADWMKLPPGSVLLVDEAQRKDILPSRGTSAASPPAWIEEFSRVRHYAIDVYLITQHPQFLETFVRRVANYHSHFERVEGGLNKSLRYHAEGMISDVSKAERLAQDCEGFDFPVQNFALYRSASDHTIKRKIPRRVVMAGVGAVVLAVVVAVGSIIVGKLTSRIGKEDAPVAETAPHPETPRPGLFARLMPQAQASTSAAVSRTYATPEAYFAALQPRVPGMPWTAPFYEGREAEAPDLACMSSEHRCACYTVPATTRYTIDDGLCRAIAREGLVNPFKAAAIRTAPAAQQQPVFAASETAPRRSASGTVGTARIGSAYIPPERIPTPVLSGIQR